MRNQSSSSKNVIAALVAAAFGLTAGPALAQTSQSHPNPAPASQRPASKKSVRQLTSSVKHEREQMQAANARLKKAAAKLKRTAHRMKQAQAKELRVASAEHGVRNGARKTRSGVHSRSAHPANNHPPR